MNQDNQIVPIVEDDQGEGWKNLVELEDLEERMSRHEKELQQEHFKAISARHSRKPR